MSTEEREREGPIEYDTFDKFREEIRRETQLTGNSDDRIAIQAVIEAVKAELPTDEVAHIREMLPKRLKEIWAGA